MPGDQLRDEPGAQALDRVVDWAPVVDSEDPGNGLPELLQQLLVGATRSLVAQLVVELKHHLPVFIDEALDHLPDPAPHRAEPRAHASGAPWVAHAPQTLAVGGLPLFLNRRLPEGVVGGGRTWRGLTRLVRRPFQPHGVGGGAHQATPDRGRSRRVRVLRGPLEGGPQAGDAAALAERSRRLLGGGKPGGQPARGIGWPL